MYADPKSKFGQALYMLFNAVLGCFAVVYPIMLLVFPLAPSFDHNYGLELPTLHISFLLFVISFPPFITVITVCLFVKRLIQLITNKGANTKIYHAIDILHILSIAIAVLSMTPLPNNLKLPFWKGAYGFIIAATASVLLLILVFMHKAEKKRNGAQKPYFMSKQKIFITVVAIIAVVAILFIPMNTNKGSYEDDPSGNIYHRTNAFAYSIIEVEDKATHGMSEPQIFFFPKNYEHTGKLFGFR